VAIDWNDQKKRQALQEALEESYPSASELEIFVDIALNENLQRIVGDNHNLRQKNYYLIKWAKSKNRLGEIFEAFKKENGSHDVIKKIEDQTVHLTLEQSEVHSSDRKLDPSEDILLQSSDKKYTKASKEDAFFPKAKINKSFPKTFEYQSATIKQKKRLMGLSHEWFIHKNNSNSIQGYVEILTSKSEKNIYLEMITIPSGYFRMGAPENEIHSSNSERPQHNVTLQSFYLGRYPVTQAQWRVVAGYDCINQELKHNPSRFPGDNRPVEGVCWADVQEFCHRLSAKTSKNYTLPSEAQWEYACRAGSVTPFFYGETISTDLANYNGCLIYKSEQKGIYRGETTEVGMFPPNDWGLYDMHGNVWEWCEDNWHDNYEHASIDGGAWIESYQTKTNWLLRGGSWQNSPKDCRSASRFDFNVGICDVGFRLCCIPPTIHPNTS
jgi:formylglycine-generating enzyme required for sulfatase activity